MQQQPNYVEKVAEEAKKKVSGAGLYHAVVLHDDLCSIWHQKPCNCNPDVSVITDKEYQKKLDKKRKGC